MKELSKTNLPSRLADQDEDEWERFRVLLKYTAGFWAGFIFAPSSLEATVIRERVAEVLASDGARMDVCLPQSPDELRDALPWIVAPERAGAGCLWIQALQVDGGGGERPWEEAWAHVFLRGNGQREVFRRRVNGGLVIVAPMAMKVLVREAAPDWWSIRAIVLELSGATAMTQQVEEPRQARLATREHQTTETAPDAEYWMHEAALRQPGSEGRAYALIQAAAGWRATGRRIEALAASQEAADIYRALAEQQPEAFEASLAKSLHNLGNCQSALGQREAALGSTQEAVKLYRKLAQDRPEAFEPYLAGSLNNLGNRQSEQGQREMAIEATQEAVELYRKLAERNPEVFEPELAKSLNNLGVMQIALGQREAGLVSTQEAVDIRRKLAQRHPEAFEPDLAMSLNNLGAMQSELGQREAALASTNEALNIRRKLAKIHPAAFEPDLATTLFNLALHLQSLAQYAEARTLAQEAFEIRWPLYQKYPEVFRQYLCKTIPLLRELHESLGEPLDATTQERIQAFEAQNP